MCNGFNHTPVISFLQISGQLTFGKDLSKWRLGASISLDQKKKKDNTVKICFKLSTIKHYHNVIILRSYTVL